MKAFLDSSSFAKRFIEEIGSDAVEEVCTEASQLALSVVCVPEIVSALNRRRRERAITKKQYLAAKRQVIEDVRDANIINLTTEVIASSLTLLENNVLRALDALHVACALEWKAELFVSSDERQLEAADRAGLKTRRV